MMKIGDKGIARDLQVGDSFKFMSGKPDQSKHVVTKDLESHFIYDYNAKKVLSKAEPVIRTDKKNTSNDPFFYQNLFNIATKELESSGDIEKFIPNFEKVMEYLSSNGSSNECKEFIEFCMDNCYKGMKYNKAFQQKYNVLKQKVVNCF